MLVSRKEMSQVGQEMMGKDKLGSWAAVGHAKLTYCLCGSFIWCRKTRNIWKEVEDLGPDSS